MWVHNFAVPVCSVPFELDCTCALHAALFLCMNRRMVRLSNRLAATKSKKEKTVSASRKTSTSWLRHLVITLCRESSSSCPYKYGNDPVN